ncbi:MAG TPA: sigma factor [Streptosporangiaceae bacterium]|nr:sigma factor [Streptosporangiaceae bacterium]
MQDSAMVAAVVAGDADGFAAAYDQYAASLYGYCHGVLSGTEAAEAVLDTFLIATAKLEGLRDPGRLGPWLHAVARNECLRRLGPGEGDPRGGGSGRRAAGDSAGRFARHGADGLRRQLPCGPGAPDERGAPRGRVRPGGLPKAIGPSGPWWWRRVRRRVREHPGVVVAAAVVATLAVTAGITVVMTAAGGSHRPQASGAALGGGVPAPASSTSAGATGRPPSPARTAPASAHPTSPAAPAGATSAGPSPGRGTPAPTASASGPSPSPSPSPSSSPAQGYLLVAPGRLTLTSKAGEPASGFFLLTAANGPVAHYTVRVAAQAGRVTVVPAGGSLLVNGHVEVTVTVTSKVALTTHVVVESGNLTVAVVYRPKPQPQPSPKPSPSSKPSPPSKASG